MISAMPSTAHFHSSSGEPSGMILPTVAGTMVISWPCSSLTIVMQSLTYLTEAARCASSFATRLRSPSISVTAPQHSRPASSRSPLTCLVS